VPCPDEADKFKSSWIGDPGHTGLKRASGFRPLASGKDYKMILFGLSTSKHRATADLQEIFIITK